MEPELCTTKRPTLRNPLAAEAASAAERGNAATEKRRANSVRPAAFPQDSLSSGVVGALAVVREIEAGFLVFLTRT